MLYEPDIMWSKIYFYDFHVLLIMYWFGVIGASVGRFVCVYAVIKSMLFK